MYANFPLEWAAMFPLHWAPPADVLNIRLIKPNAVHHFTDTQRVLTSVQAIPSGWKIFYRLSAFPEILKNKADLRLPLLFSLWEAVYVLNSVQAWIHVLDSVQAWIHRALLFLMKAHAKVFMYLNDPHLMGTGQTMYLVHSPKLRTNFSLKSNWGLELLFSPWIRTSRFKYK